MCRLTFFSIFCPETILFACGAGVEFYFPPLFYFYVPIVPRRYFRYFQPTLNVVVARPKAPYLTPHTSEAPHSATKDVSPQRNEALGGRDPSRDELHRTCEHVRRSFDGRLFSDYPRDDGKRDRRTSIVAQPARDDAIFDVAIATNPLHLVDERSQNPGNPGESSNGRTSHQGPDLILTRNRRIPHLRPNPKVQGQEGDARLPTQHSAE